MNYLSTQDDRDVAAKALKLVRKIMLNSKTFKKSYWDADQAKP